MAQPGLTPIAHCTAVSCSKASKMVEIEFFFDWQLLIKTWKNLVNCFHLKNVPDLPLCNAKSTQC